MKKLSKEEACTSTPILAYAEFRKLLKLHKNACMFGLATILCQNQNETGRIIGYVSRTLSKIECKYLANKLEFLALRSVINVQIHEYLYGKTVIVYMDNNLLFMS